MGFIDPSELDPPSSGSTIGGRFIDPSELDPPPQTTGESFTGGALNLLNSLTFGLGDEITAGGASLADLLSGGPGYDARLQQARELRSGFRNENPWLATGSDLASGFALPLGNALGAVKGLVPTTKALVKTGAGLGAAYGFGEGEGGLGNRLSNAVTGGAIGGVASPILGGALIGTGKAISGLGSTYRGVKDFISPNIQKSGEELALDTLSQYTNPTTLSETLKLNPKIAYPELTRTAEIANDPGLMKLTQTLERSADIPEAGLRGISIDDQRALSRMGDILKAQGPIPSDERAGQVVRGALEENLGKLDESIKQQFNKATGSLNIFGAKAKVSDALKSVEDYGLGVPPSVKSYIDKFRRLPNKIPIKQLQAYRSQTGKMAKALGRSTDPTDQAGGRVLSAMFGGIADAEEVAASTGAGITKATQKALQKGRELRTTKGIQFEENATGTILDRNTFNRYEQLDSNVVDKVLRSPEDARQVLANLKGQPRSKQAIQAAFIERLKKTDQKGDLIPNTFTQLWKGKQDIAKEVLSPDQFNAVNKVVSDMRSQANIKRKAFGASVGQSITSESADSLGLLKDMIASGARSKLGFLAKVFSSIGETRTAKIQSKANEILVDLAFDRNFAKDFTTRATTQSVERLAKGFIEKASEKIQGLGINIPRLAPTLSGALAPTDLGNINDKSSLSQAINKGSFMEDTAKPPTVLEEKKSEPASKIPPQVKKEIEANPYFHAAALAESNMDPLAKNPKSSAEGLFQFIDKTARAIGLQDKFDPAQSFEAMKTLTKQNAAIVGNDPEWLYAAHVLGPSLAKKLKLGRTADLSGRDKGLIEYFRTKALPNFRRSFNKIKTIET